MTTTYGNRSGLRGNKRGQLTLSGNTYPHRDWLRAFASYDKIRKVWTAPAPSNNRDASALAYELRKRGIEAK